MATMEAAVSGDVLARRVGIIRLTASGAITAGLLFLLCWLGTFVPFSSPTHAYISLFTNAPAGSAQALWEGTCWSVLFGALVAVVFATIYNSLDSLEPR